MSKSNDKQQEQDGRTDFDFFIGSWKIGNKNLPERLKGATTWKEFGGASVARKLLGGLGHAERSIFVYGCGTPCLSHFSRRSESGRPVPGEKHWHGAAPTTAMTHLAIQEQLDHCWACHGY